MRVRTLTVLALAFGAAAPLAAGEKAKSLEVGPKGLEVKGEVANTDNAVGIDLGGETIKLIAKEYVVKLQAGKKYRVDLIADTPMYDPVLAIMDEGGKQLAVDDDGGGALNSRLTFEPKKDGAYKLVSASLGGNAGAFTLRVVALESAKADAKEHVVGKDVLGFDGELTADKTEVIYKVKLKANTNYRIEMMSKKVDSYVEVHDADGKKLAEDDDSGGGLNSRLVFRPTADGVYRLLARSFNRGQTGDFRLEIREE